MDSRTNRSREQTAAPAIDAIGTTAPVPAASGAGKTTTISGTYPSKAASYFAIQPFAVGGPETEGQAFSTTNQGSPFLAANIGTGVPPQGTNLRYETADGRAVIAYYT